MKTILVTLGYLKWHYGKAICSLTKIWGNFLFFIYEFFSIRLLVKNFFDPWKRMAEDYPKGFDLKKYFYIFIANSIVRIVGIIMRTILILIGLTGYILLALLYPVALILWIFLPIIIFILIGSGLYLIIK